MRSTPLTGIVRGRRQPDPATANELAQPVYLQVRRVGQLGDTRMGGGRVEQTPQAAFHHAGHGPNGLPLRHQEPLAALDLERRDLTGPLMYLPDSMNRPIAVHPGDAVGRTNQQGRFG